MGKDFHENHCIKINKPLIYSIIFNIVKLSSFVTSAHVASLKIELI